MLGVKDKSPVDFFVEDIKDLVFKGTHIEHYLERERKYMKKHSHSRAHEWLRAPLIKEELDIFLTVLHVAFPP